MKVKSKIKNTEEGREDPRLDKFYDETPQAKFTFQLFVNNTERPYELYYKIRLDGDEGYNEKIVSLMQERAQADMQNLMQRFWADDPYCEFKQWKLLDERGQIIKTSDVLSVHVKPAPNSRNRAG